MSKREKEKQKEINQETIFFFRQWYNLSEKKNYTKSSSLFFVILGTLYIVINYVSRVTRKTNFLTLDKENPWWVFVHIFSMPISQMELLLHQACCLQLLVLEYKPPSLLDSSWNNNTKINLGILFSFPKSKTQDRSI